MTRKNIQSISLQVPPVCLGPPLSKSYIRLLAQGEDLPSNMPHPPMPRILLSLDDVLYLSWGPLGAGANANGVLYVKIAGKNVPARATDTSSYNTGGDPAEYVLSAKWKTQRGNMLVSRPPPGSAYLFSVDRNNNVWVASDDYANRTNLGDQGIKSAFPPAGCLQYGMPGSRWGTKTRIALFWKNVSNNYTSACTIDI